MQMYRTARLAQWPHRPSTLWNLRAEGYDPAQCLDFDFAVLDWWDRFEGFRKAQKRTVVPASARLGKNQMWAPEYGSDADILTKRYGVSFGEATGSELDPIVAAMSDDELWEAVDGWDA
jgi:hypothetical protein